MTTRLALRVSPGARTTAFVGRHGDSWKVRVAAPAEDGRANDAVVALLAATLELPPRTISIVAGHGRRDKLVELAGIAPDEAERRLAAVGERKRGMTTIDVESFKTRLRRSASGRSKAIAYLHEENRGTTEDEQRELSGGLDNHLADIATHTYDRELDSTLEESEEQHLAHVEGALTGSRPAPTASARTAASRSGRAARGDALGTLCIDCKRKAERG